MILLKNIHFIKIILIINILYVIKRIVALLLQLKIQVKKISSNTTTIKKRIIFNL